MSERDADAIRRLLYAYADSVLVQDGSAWGALWTEDATWELGPERTLRGRQPIVDHWHTSMTAYRRVVQLYLSSSASIDGDLATGRAYFVELNVPADGDRRMLAAYYDDDYRREDGTWRFARRALVRLYSGAPDLTGIFPDLEPEP